MHRTRSQSRCGSACSPGGKAAPAPTETGADTRFQFPPLCGTVSVPPLPLFPRGLLRNGHTKEMVTSPTIALQPFSFLLGNNAVPQASSAGGHRRHVSGRPGPSGQGSGVLLRATEVQRKSKGRSRVLPLLSHDPSPHCGVRKRKSPETPNIFIPPPPSTAACFLCCAPLSGPGHS